MSSEFFEKYKHKIITVERLISLLSRGSKTKNTILCHGVFDVVHPGHVRHLAYAKSQADILIVSITADKYIDKGAYRPHIPERLRALNLAAFEMVDYVLIDQNKKPLNLLSRLKPLLFTSKGFEYTSAGLPPATEEESDVIKSYGGELIFTPGDIVYSSTRFINTSLPQVQMAKLSLLMDTNNISFKSLRTCINKFKNKTVHVISDTIVDSYTRTTLIGGQTKTPTFSVLYGGRDDYVGAGIVAKHLNAAGASVEFTTVLYDDDLGSYVIDDLKKRK